MRNLLTVSLCLVVAAGCCSRKHSSPYVLDVPVVSSEKSPPVVPPFAFNQLADGRLSVVGSTKHRVFSMSDGLANVRTVSQNPIVAATDQDGWFFFATSVAMDATTHKPAQFISGYAIRDGSRQIVYWSTW